MVSRRYVRIAAGVAAVAAVVGVGAAVTANDNQRGFRERLTGFEEVPALSTAGSGNFRAFISRSGDEISYRLTYSDFATNVLQAHIHFENATNNGPIVVFLCTNLGNGPAGTQVCPVDGGTIEGTITAADVGAGAAAVGIAAGEMDEFVAAVRADATYVNVHTMERPGGEIRAQLD